MPIFLKKLQIIFMDSRYQRDICQIVYKFFKNFRKNLQIVLTRLTGSVPPNGFVLPLSFSTLIRTSRSPAHVPPAQPRSQQNNRLLNSKSETLSISGILIASYPKAGCLLFTRNRKNILLANAPYLTFS